MANLNVALILRLVDRATGPARRAMHALERIGGQGIVAQADRAARASRMIAGGMGRIAQSAAVAGGAVAAYTGILSGIGAAFVRPAAQFERFNVQLTNLEGSSGGAKRAMGWIEDFATRTPLKLEDTVAAYAKLKAFGLDPTNGSLQAIVDTLAAAGGGAEQMDGIVLALGQAWTKQKLQGEEAMQLLERGVPVWDLLAQKTGRTAAELTDMASAGKLGRAEINLLIEAMGERNAGASENMSKTWGGITSNLMDHWTRFQRMVMDAGLFDFMKGRLQDLLTLLNAAAADGRLQAWATTVAETILWAMKALERFGVWLYDTWTTVWPVLDRVAQAIGGWDVVAWAAGFLMFKSTILGALGGVAMAARGVLVLGQMLLANPIIAVISAVAGLAFVIYRNWDGIVGYFTGKIDRIRAAFADGLLNGVLRLLSEFNPFKLMIDSAVGLLNYLTGWDLSGVKSHLYDAFGINLFDQGVQMILSLWAGLKAKIGEMTTWLVNQIQAAMPSWMKDGAAARAGVGEGLSSPMGDGIDIGGGRATGGPVRRGQAQPVGENGIEIFTPDRDGWIIPHRQVAGRMAPHHLAGGAVPPLRVLAAVQARFGDVSSALLDRIGTNLAAFLDSGAAALVALSQGLLAPQGDGLDIGGGRATGGPVRRGQAQPVGENGIEIFTPDRDGWIIPHRQVAGGRARAGGGAVVHLGGITINAAPGMSPQQIARAVADEIDRRTREGRFALNDGGAYA